MVGFFEGFQFLPGIGLRSVTTQAVISSAAGPGRRISTFKALLLRPHQSCMCGGCFFDRAIRF